jgi:hypothetical protein
MNYKDLKEAIRLATRQALKEVHLKEQGGEPAETQKFCDDLRKSFKKHFPNSYFSCTIDKRFGLTDIYISFSLGKGKEEYLNGIFHNDPLATRMSIPGLGEDGAMPPVIAPRMGMGGGVDLHYFSRIKVWRNFKTPSPAVALQKFDAFFAKLKSTVKDNLDNLRNVNYDPTSKI